MKLNANRKLAAKLACKMPQRIAIAFTFVLLVVLAVQAVSQVTYQGTVAGSDGSSGVVVYTLPNAPTTQTTIGLRNTGKKTSSGTLAITPALVTAPASPVAPPPIVPVTQPSPPVTGINGAAITVTNPAGPIYPLDGVFVNCHSSSFSDAQLLTSNILWNFGDPGSPLNTMKGFSAAHCYASPGIYTITLTITLTGGSVSTATQSVTVAQDMRPVVAVKSGGSLQNLASNTAYSLATNGTYGAANLSGLTHVLIRGNGATINGGKQNCVTGSAGTSACTVAGVNFTVGSNGAADGCDPVGNGLTFLGSLNSSGGAITACENGFNLNQNPSNVLIQGWTVPDGSATATKTTMDGYFAWVQGQEINIIGNSVANSISQAEIRADATGTRDVNLSFNSLTKTSPAGQTYKNCWTCMWVDYSSTYANTFTNGAMQTGPLDPGVDGQTPKTATCSNVLVDSNVFKNAKMLVSPNTEGLEFTNNVIHPPDTNAIWIDGSGDYSDVTWVSSNLCFGNDTVQSTDGDGCGFIVFAYGGSVSGVSVVNCVYDAPNVGYGEYDNAFIYTGSVSVKALSAVSGNVLYDGSNVSSSADCVNGTWMGQPKFDSTYGLGTNTVQAINFGATWQAVPSTGSGQAAGSSLPVTGN
jgi:hypothetical protein